VTAVALFCLAVPVLLCAADDPLPIVHARTEAPLQLSSLSYPPATSMRYVALAVEPQHDEQSFVPASLSIPAATPSRALEFIRTALDANDFRTFQIALQHATELADALPLGAARNALRREVMIYRDVETAWNFARTDRFGAFFDDESLPGFRDHLAADYAGYASFIRSNVIVDGRGVELYPTSETRAFLLRQLDTHAPRFIEPTLTASTRTASTHARHARHIRATSTAMLRRSHRAAKHVPVKVAAAKTETVAAPATAAAAPVVVAAVPFTKPVQDAFAMPPEATADLPKKVQHPAVAAVQPADAPSTTFRGISFIVLALLVLGGLIALLRAPEAMPTVVPAPDATKREARSDEPVPMKKAQ
jgi:hypothetical protein